MKTWLLASILFGVCSFLAPAEEQKKYHVQFVQGTNEEKPPTATARLIGPKLSQKLSPVFRWKYYWELNKQEITTEARRITTVQLNASRSLEIERGAKNEIELRLYRERHLVRKSRHQSDKKMMAIMGGEEGADNAWFVVVRAEKPR